MYTCIMGREKEKIKEKLPRGFNRFGALFVPGLYYTGFFSLRLGGRETVGRPEAFSRFLRSSQMASKS